MFIKIHSVLAKAKKNTSGSYTQRRNFSWQKVHQHLGDNGCVANVNEDKMLKEKHMDVWSSGQDDEQVPHHDDCVHDEEKGKM